MVSVSRDLSGETPPLHKRGAPPRYSLGMCAGGAFDAWIFTQDQSRVIFDNSLPHGKDIVSSVSIVGELV